MSLQQFLKEVIIEQKYDLSQISNQLGLAQSEHQLLTVDNINDVLIEQYFHFKGDKKNKSSQLLNSIFLNLDAKIENYINQKNSQLENKPIFQKRKKVKIIKVQKKQNQKLCSDNQQPTDKLEKIQQKKSNTSQRKYKQQIAKDKKNDISQSRNNKCINKQNPFILNQNDEEKFISNNSNANKKSKFESQEMQKKCLVILSDKQRNEIQTNILNEENSELNKKANTIQFNEEFCQPVIQKKQRIDEKLIIQSLESQIKHLQILKKNNQIDIKSFQSLFLLFKAYKQSIPDNQQRNANLMKFVSLMIQDEIKKRENLSQNYDLLKFFDEILQLMKNNFKFDLFIINVENQQNDQVNGNILLENHSSVKNKELLAVLRELVISFPKQYTKSVGNIKIDQSYFDKINFNQIELKVHEQYLIQNFIKNLQNFSNLSLEFLKDQFLHQFEVTENIYDIELKDILIKQITHSIQKERAIKENIMAILNYHTLESASSFHLAKLAQIRPRSYQQPFPLKIRDPYYQLSKTEAILNILNNEKMKFIKGGKLESAQLIYQIMMRVLIFLISIELFIIQDNLFENNLRVRYLKYSRR